MKTKIFTFLFALIASIGTLFAESGTCGTNLTWDFTDGVLTISGTGKMHNYNRSQLPWSGLQITSVIINSGVTTIGNRAFVNCSGMASVTISNSVTSIGMSAFFNCTSLTSIEIPNSVTSIGMSAFFNCTSLTSIEIPNSVTSIESYAFDSCTGLKSITCLAVTPPTMGEGVFYELDCSTINLMVPAESVEDYKNADQWKDFFTGTALDRIAGDAPRMNHKCLRNGRLLILRGDKTYTLTGQEVK
jgi:hypothetical protein